MKNKDEKKRRDGETDANGSQEKLLKREMKGRKGMTCEGSEDPETDGWEEAEGREREE